MSKEHSIYNVGIGDVVGVAVESGRFGPPAASLHPFEEENEAKYGAERPVVKLVRLWWW